MRALVVDDSRAMRAILKRILVGLGFEVLEAGNGREALDRLAEVRDLPDIALVDWNMPEMNGIELLRALRSNRRFDKMRLMMVTTETEMEKVATALDAGADEYAMKPFTPEVIADKLAVLGLLSGV